MRWWQPALGRHRRLPRQDALMNALRAHPLRSLRWYARWPTSFLLLVADAGSLAGLGGGRSVPVAMALVALLCRSIKRQVGDRPALAVGLTGKTSSGSTIAA